MTRQVKSSATSRANVQIADVSRVPLTLRGPGRNTAIGEREDESQHQQHDRHQVVAAGLEIPAAVLTQVAAGDEDGERGKEDAQGKSHAVNPSG